MTGEERHQAEYPFNLRLVHDCLWFLFLQLLDGIQIGPFDIAEGLLLVFLVFVGGFVDSLLVTHTAGTDEQLFAVHCKDCIQMLCPVCQTAA